MGARAAYDSLRTRASYSSSCVLYTSTLSNKVSVFRHFNTRTITRVQSTGAEAYSFVFRPESLHSPPPLPPRGLPCTCREASRTRLLPICPSAFHRRPRRHPRRRPRNRNCPAEAEVSREDAEAEWEIDCVAVAVAKSDYASERQFEGTWRAARGALREAPPDSLLRLVLLVLVLLAALGSPHFRLLGSARYCPPYMYYIYWILKTYTSESEYTAHFSIRDARNTDTDRSRPSGLSLHSSALVPSQFSVLLVESTHPRVLRAIE